MGHRKPPPPHRVARPRPASTCLAAKVTDLSPLKGMPLKELRCDFQRERDTEILRSLTTLERINDKPAKDFWKKGNQGE